MAWIHDAEPYAELALAVAAILLALIQYFLARGVYRLHKENVQIEKRRDTAEVHVVEVLTREEPNVLRIRLENKGGVTTKVDHILIWPEPLAGPIEGILAYQLAGTQKVKMPSMEPVPGTYVAGPWVAHMLELEGRTQGVVEVAFDPPLPGGTWEAEIEPLVKLGRGISSTHLIPLPLTAEVTYPPAPSSSEEE